MSSTPDFDRESLLREAFTNFRSAPLPASAHTADAARATIRRRRQVRKTVLAAVAVLAVVIPAGGTTLINNAGHRPTAAAPAAPTPSTTGSNPLVIRRPSASTPSHSTPAADLVVSASELVTNGSIGTVIGVAEVTVHNRGPATVDTVDLTFTLDGPRTSGYTWNDCERGTTARIVTCHRPAPAARASTSYGFEFTIVFGQRLASPVVTVRPSGANDARPSDNSTELTICTNGCTGRQPRADLTVTASEVVTDGSSGPVTGTVRVTVTNHGPTPSDLVLLTFPTPVGFQPTGDSSQDCRASTVDQTTTCSRPAPAVNAKRSYTFQFSVDLSVPPTGLSVTVAADLTNDPTPSDNTAELTICTKGCDRPEADAAGTSPSSTAGTV